MSQMHANKYPGVLYIAAAFILSVFCVAATTVYGNPHNSLHTSAQSWAFSIIIGIIAAYGISQTPFMFGKTISIQDKKSDQ